MPQPLTLMKIYFTVEFYMAIFCKTVIDKISERFILALDETKAQNWQSD